MNFVTGLLRYRRFSGIGQCLKLEESAALSIRPQTISRDEQLLDGDQRRGALNERIDPTMETFQAIPSADLRIKIEITEEMLDGCLNSPRELIANDLEVKRLLPVDGWG